MTETSFQNTQHWLLSNGRAESFVGRPFDKLRISPTKAPRRAKARPTGGVVLRCLQELHEHDCQRVGTMTSRSVPDSAPPTSPARPSSCRTLAPSRSDGTITN